MANVLGQNSGAEQQEEARAAPGLCGASVQIRGKHLRDTG